MKMPFGKYRGVELRELPDDYLQWLYSEFDLKGRLKSAVYQEYKIRSSRITFDELNTLDGGKIKKIYYRLAMQYHPDKCGGNGDIMKGINLFYDELKAGG